MAKPQTNHTKSNRVRREPRWSADRIRTFRLRHKWSQQELALKLAVHGATVAHWEGGQTTPSPLAEEKLDRLAKGD